MSDEKAADSMSAKDSALCNPSEGELFHVLLATIPDSIYFKDKRSRFLKISKYLMDKFGVTDERAVEGKTDFDFFTIEHARQAFKDEQEVLRTGRPIVGIEEKETWANRSDTWVSTTKMPLRNGRGEIIGTFGLSRDITEIKNYRDELQKTKHELERRVKERTAELSEAKSRLERHVEQLTFLNVTAYELAHAIGIDAMFVAIGKAFLARFPGCTVSICQVTGAGYACVYAAGGLDSPAMRRLSETLPLQCTEEEISRPLSVKSPRTEKAAAFDGGAPFDGDPCWIAIPLRAETAILALVQIFGPPWSEIVFHGEETLLSTLAAHAAACLNNALHYRYMETKARLEGELETARNIQQSLTPHEKPTIPRINLAGVYKPAYEIGGDYLDYFQCGDGSWAVIVADVCGKGVPAALLMTILRSVARVEARTHFSAKSLLCAINESINLTLSERSFVTALCLVIRDDGMSMSYARAGHTKLLKFDAAQQKIVTIDSKGIALGIVPTIAEFSSQLEEIIMPLIESDTYVAYTDGISEAANARKTIFGQAGMIQSIRKHSRVGAEKLVEGVLEDVRLFVENKPILDDCTIVAMTVTG